MGEGGDGRERRIDRVGGGVDVRGRGKHQDNRSWNLRK